MPSKPNLGSGDATTMGIGIAVNDIAVAVELVYVATAYEVAAVYNQIAAITHYTWIVDERPITKK